MRKSKKEPLLIEFTSKKVPTDNPKVLRIILHPDFTRVDFGYNATSEFINGGWIRMSPKTHLKVEGSSKKHALTDTLGITIAPEKVVFKSNKDWKFFSLFFEPIPQVDCTINIIEEENPTPNDFNYYGISLKMDGGGKIF